MKMWEQTLPSLDNSGSRSTNGDIDISRRIVIQPRYRKKVAIATLDFHGDDRLLSDVERERRTIFLNRHVVCLSTRIQPARRRILIKYIAYREWESAKKRKRRITYLAKVGILIAFKSSPYRPRFCSAVRIINIPEGGDKSEPTRRVKRRTYKWAFTCLRH